MTDVGQLWQMLASWSFSFPFCLPEYMNQQLSETSRSSRLSEVYNPNYEDLSLVWGDSSTPFPLEDLKLVARPPEGHEYLNTGQSSLPVDNPDYQDTYLPQATPTTSPANGRLLPAAENLEYLGLGAALQAPVR